jgi:CheY-like chemotaxis protein
VAKRALTSAGYRVLEASGGDAGLAVLQQQRVDLLVTDVVMPGLSGREVAERASHEWPGLKVLFVSGYTDDAVVRHGVLREQVAFLSKPFGANELVKKVRQVLDANGATVIPIGRALQRPA